MNGINFFSWLRDGVRQSVLLGVSDAVEQLGTPPTSDEIHPSVAALLHSQSTSSVKNRLPGPVGGSSPERRRLGKSLKEMNAPKSSEP